MTKIGLYDIAGIRLRRDSWNMTIVTQNVQKVRSWRYWLQESETLMLQTDNHLEGSSIGHYS